MATSSTARKSPSPDCPVGSASAGESLVMTASSSRGAVSCRGCQPTGTSGNGTSPTRDTLSQVTGTSWPIDPHYLGYNVSGARVRPLTRRQDTSLTLRGAPAFIRRLLSTHVGSVIDRLATRTVHTRTHPASGLEARLSRIGERSRPDATTRVVSSTAHSDGGQRWQRPSESDSRLCRSTHVFGVRPTSSAFGAGVRYRPPARVDTLDCVAPPLPEAERDRVHPARTARAST